MNDTDTSAYAQTLTNVRKTTIMIDKRRKQNEVLGFHSRWNSRVSVSQKSVYFLLSAQIPIAVICMSSQERVSVGDEFSVSSSFEEKTVVPVLVSPRKGQIVVDDKELKNYKVELEHLSSSKSKKINIFQYKNKTGNRRRVGYRENSKIVKVKSIQGLESAEEE